MRGYGLVFAGKTRVPVDLPLRCRCGHVHGVASEVAPFNGFRLVCYCKDCQAFARFLDRPEVLDAAGGTDIFQMPTGPREAYCWHRRDALPESATVALPMLKITARVRPAPPPSGEDYRVQPQSEGFQSSNRGRPSTDQPPTDEDHRANATGHCARPRTRSSVS